MALPFVFAALFLLQQTPKSAIEGIVLRIGTDEPIAGAQIILRRVPAGAPRQPDGEELSSSPTTTMTTTDREGKFALRDLPAGSYRITAARNGYTKQEYRQRTIGGSGTTAALEEGQTLKDVIFRLTPAGNVSGQVRDYAGEPTTGMHVQLLRSAYNERGQRAFHTVASARTNDRGEYRFYWITPGRYYLSAGIRNQGEMSAFGSPNEMETGSYPTTYYPGTANPSEASVIDVQPGIELNAIDIVVAQQGRYRIRGRIVTATGQPPKIAGISLVPRHSMVDINVNHGATQHYSSLNGAFEIPDVAPGSYFVIATTQPDLSATLPAETTGRSIEELFIHTLVSMMSVAQAAVDVSNADVENLVIAFLPKISIRGRLTIEGRDSSTADLQRTHVRLAPTNSNTWPAVPQPPSRIAPDGTFSLDSVSQGEYRVTVDSPQPEIYLKEARFDAADVANQSWQINGPLSGTLDIVLSSKAGQIDGLLVNEQGQPVPGVEVILIPDLLRERNELYKKALTDQSGRFSLRGITPGEYKVFAWEAIEEFAYYDLDYLRQFEQRGRPVSISESSKVAVEVKVIPVPQ